MRTFSSAVSCGNTAEIWNERTMPIRATSCGLRAGDVAALEQDAPAGHRGEPGEQIEVGRLAGAVGADQRVDGAALHIEADSFTATKPAKDLRHCLGAQQHIVRPTALCAIYLPRALPATSGQPP